MPFQQLVEKYQRRRKAALTDAIAAGLAFSDEIAVDIGALSDGGLLPELLDTMSLALPFVLVAVTEGGQALLKKKTPEAAVQDAVHRTVKTGVALSAGAAAAALGAAGAALPVAIGARLAVDRFRTKAMLARRVIKRTERLRALARLRTPALGAEPLIALAQSAADRLP